MAEQLFNEDSPFLSVTELQATQYHILLGRNWGVVEARRCDAFNIFSLMPKRGW